MVAGPDALRGEVVGELVGPLLHLSVRAALAVADDVLPLAEVVRRVLEEVGEVELHGPRLEHVLTGHQMAGAPPDERRSAAGSAHAYRNAGALPPPGGSDTPSPTRLPPIAS